MTSPIIFKKICLLGDFAAGKTSLVRRYVDNKFSDTYLSTIGVSISRKLVNLTKDSGGAVSVQVVLWDLEGETLFTESAGTYMQGAHAAIIVGDVSRPETLEHMSKHISSFLTVNPRASVAAAYNKCDLITGGALQAPHTMSPHGQVIASVLTSAKQGDGVTVLFETLCKHLIGM